jgi:mono/diheme cytochrome c family protein
MTNQSAAKRRSRLLPFALCLLPFVASCRQDMHDAPTYRPYRSSTLFPDGASARPLVTGAVARGFLREDDHLYAGKVNGQPATSFPFPITGDDLDRGQQRFNIYCSPCHGRTGEGNGMVVQRGYKQAANYHIDRLRQAPVGYLFDVITNGFGAMPDYRMQITPEDRWRVIAYIRALQLSHNTPAADVPADQMRKLNSGGVAAEPAKPEGRSGGHQ